MEAKFNDQKKINSKFKDSKIELDAFFLGIKSQSFSVNN